jgi:hypothetical protein
MFVCESDQESVDMATFNSTDCPACGPDSTLDLSQGQRLLEHIAAHILHDSKIERSVETVWLVPSIFSTVSILSQKGTRRASELEDRLGPVYLSNEAEIFI